MFARIIFYFHSYNLFLTMYLFYYLGPGRDLTKVEETYVLPHFRTLGVLPITDGIDFRICTMVFKALHQCSMRVQNILKPLFNFTHRCTKQTTCENLYVPNFKLNMTRNPLCYIGLFLYSKLSFEIRSSSSLPVFRRKCKQSLSPQL